MIVVDASIWVDHFRQNDNRLTKLMGEDALRQHPFITGEVGMGNFTSRRARAEIVEILMDLAQFEPVDEGDFHAFVADNRLYGSGVGFIDCHLLASLSSEPAGRLWTRDRRLVTQATRLGIKLFD